MVPPKIPGPHLKRPQMRSDASFDRPLLPVPTEVPRRLEGPTLKRKAGVDDIKSTKSPVRDSLLVPDTGIADNDTKCTYCMESDTKCMFTKPDSPCEECVTRALPCSYKERDEFHRREGRHHAKQRRSRYNYLLEDDEDLRARVPRPAPQVYTISSSSEDETPIMVTEARQNNRSTRRILEETPSSVEDPQDANVTGTGAQSKQLASSVDNLRPNTRANTSCMSNPDWTPTQLPDHYPIHKWDEILAIYSGPSEDSPFIRFQHKDKSAKVVDLATRDGRRPKDVPRTAQITLRTQGPGSFWTIDVRWRRFILKGGRASGGWRYYYWAGQEEGFKGPIAFNHPRTKSSSGKTLAPNLDMDPDAQNATEAGRSRLIVTLANPELRKAQALNAEAGADEQESAGSETVTSPLRPTTRSQGKTQTPRIETHATEQESAMLTRPKARGEALLQAINTPPSSIEPVNNPETVIPSETPAESAMNPNVSLDPLSEPALLAKSADMEPASAEVASNELPLAALKRPVRYSQDNTIMRIYLVGSTGCMRVPFSHCRASSDFFACITDACNMTLDQIAKTTVVIDSVEGKLVELVRPGVDTDFKTLIWRLEDTILWGPVSGRCWLDVHVEQISHEVSLTTKPSRLHLLADDIESESANERSAEPFRLRRRHIEKYWCWYSSVTISGSFLYYQMTKLSLASIARYLRGVDHYIIE